MNRWALYEAEKAKFKGLPPKEYEKALRELASRLRV